MNNIMILALLAIIVFVNAQRFDRIDINVEIKQRNLFEEWIVKHEKVYATAGEKLQRYRNFQQSIERAEKLNQRSTAGGSSATYGLTKFSDMTPEEFQTVVLMKKRTSVRSEYESHNPDNDIPQQAPPKTFDWRTLNKVTPVKDQEQCGSCWAFSVTETVESGWMLSHGINASQMQPLAPQQIVDCDTVDDGCGGGNTPTAYAYIMSAGGLDTSAQYPYTAEDGTCHTKSPFYASINNWKYATSDYDEGQMVSSLVSQGPLSICLDAANWQDYTSGVMTAWECAWINTLDHCVQAVGYDMTASTPYWIVRNSWGTSWGESGYILLEYGANTCGLADEPTYVLAPN